MARSAEPGRTTNARRSHPATTQAKKTGDGDVRNDHAEVDIGEPQERAEHRICAGEQQREECENGHGDQQRPADAARIPATRRPGAGLKRCVAEQERDDAGGDVETCSECGSNQVTDAGERQARDRDRVAAHGEQSQRDEHRRQVKKLEHGGIAPAQAGGKEHCDGEPGAAFAREAPAITPHEDDDNDGEGDDPEEESQPRQPVPEQGIRQDAEQGGTAQRPPGDDGGPGWAGRGELDRCGIRGRHDNSALAVQRTLQRKVKPHKACGDSIEA
jgi:hypothetical protein